MDKQSLKRSIPILIVCIIFLIAFLLVCLSKVKDTVELKQRCIKEAEGVIVNLQKSTLGTSSEIRKQEAKGKYLPVYEYVTNSGKIIKIEGTIPTKKKVGYRFKMYYNPDNLEEVFIPIELDIVNLVLGIVLLALFILLFIYAIISNIIQLRGMKNNE